MRFLIKQVRIRPEPDPDVFFFKSRFGRIRIFFSNQDLAGSGSQQKVVGSRRNRTGSWIRYIISFESLKIKLQGIFVPFNNYQLYKVTNIYEI